ncbi:FecCD family ABC transporter permease [Demequina sediminicola]|uniref:FecCD family ABC transporter permease n=1 Tax=Demequina sediminicola TaxID=1095026 RepID=UPI0007862FF3|nr:iron chelate uptake ABC transporter family permease subunit [Demequina sediminicola]
MRVVRLGPFGVLTHTRVIVVGWVLFAVASVFFLLGLTVGPVEIPLGDALAAAFGFTTDSQADFIVGQLRAPRTFTTVLIGIMFALAGAILQSLTRNPLASPDFIGISAGAGAGAVAVIAFAGATSAWLVAAGAGIGGIVAAAIIIALAWHGGIVPLRMVLTGIGIGFVASAVSQYLLTVMDINNADQALVWLVGSTANRTWQHVAVAAVILAVMIPIIVTLSRSLRTMEMGDETAEALGIPVARARLLLVLCAVLLAAGATAVVGPVGFIALVSPALARRLTRAPGVTLIPAALMGAALALVADYAAQHATGDMQLPIGLYTAAIGAPYLLWLVGRSARGGQQ